ncbi:GNAT family N-acetyltransferase [Phaeacidiphilus oryzae]|jgi:ribosomal protein S18 acetylase RimI-like enzyme|uniref:GNAT family N-acetyltransferase n=1 Tax=Phaeacidiphilus oryzae TaxID=348818 RepID=UPI0005684FAB|nr:GNAT family N-acetyltransferase [Phaeacidiphilus oryzae]
MTDASLTAPSIPAAAPDFRIADLDDVPALVDLVESAYRGGPGAGGWTTEAHLIDGQRTDREQVSEIITAEGGLILVAEVESAGPGGRAIAASCQLEDRGATAYFGMFAVDPGSQGAGLGRALLARAESYAREEWGAERMEMTVIEQRADLIAWYERRGYRRTGEFEPFPYGDERFGLPRRPDLRFERLVKEFGAGERRDGA